jgi:hypothetical protein
VTGWPELAVTVPMVALAVRVASVVKAELPETGLLHLASAGSVVPEERAERAVLQVTAAMVLMLPQPLVVAWAVLVAMVETQAAVVWAESEVLVQLLVPTGFPGLLASPVVTGGTGVTVTTGPVAREAVWTVGRVVLEETQARSATEVTAATGGTEANPEIVVPGATAVPGEMAVRGLHGPVAVVPVGLVGAAVQAAMVAKLSQR